MMRSMVEKGYNSLDRIVFVMNRGSRTGQVIDLINHDHAISPCKQTVHQMTPHESRPTGHHDPQPQWDFPGSI